LLDALRSTLAHVVGMTSIQISAPQQADSKQFCAARKSDRLLCLSNHVVDRAEYPQLPLKNRQLISFSDDNNAPTQSHICPCCLPADPADPFFFDGREFMHSVPPPVPPGQPSCVAVKPVMASPVSAARNVIAKGMKRFEVGKVAPKQPRWERLSDCVVNVLGMNPSFMTLNGTNCYLVGTGANRLLIDTGDGDNSGKMLAALEEAMEATGCSGIQEIIITHVAGD
jgi:hypothetical protein